MLNTIKPYLSITAALLLIIALAADTYLLNILTPYLQMGTWSALVTSIVLVFAQIVRLERHIKNTTNQLLIVKERLTNEIKHRLWAEKAASESKVKSMIIDENIPIMLAYFNLDLRCRYHNRIFRRWFGLKPDQIDDKLLTEFSGEEFHSAIKSSINEILVGKTIHHERILKSIKGLPYIFTEQYIPHLDSKGKTIGFYTVHNPRAQEKTRTATKPSIPDLGEAPALQKTVNQHVVPSKEETHSPKVVTSSLTIDSTAANRIAQAIEKGEFSLFYQEISPLQSSIITPIHYEILVRMQEEENSLMPPDSFFPFIDQYKLMPQLDRWIASCIIQWLSSHADSKTLFCLNVAKDTLLDRNYAGFIQDQLASNHVTPSQLCFEIEMLDVGDSLGDTLLFIDKIKELGCQVSLCSFDGNPEFNHILNDVKVDYLKIDGSLVCNILRDPNDLEQVTSINQLAHQNGIKTIGELVESDEIIAKLSELGIDYAQGFGVAKARPFRELE